MQPNDNAEQDGQSRAGERLAELGSAAEQWPDPPSFEEMSRIVQQRLAGPSHDALVEQVRRHEERWAATRKQGKSTSGLDDLIGVVDDPSFPRSAHLHEDLYGEGTSD